MSDEGGDEMPPYRRRFSSSAAPLEDDDLLGEILLRLPLQPSSLLRASLVCKPWQRLTADAAFQCRFRAHHRRPPVLGLFVRQHKTLEFTSVLDPPDRIPSERFSLRVCNDNTWEAWCILGCRHGRVLVFNWKRRQILVFDPVSGDRRTVAVPPEFHGEKKFDVAVNGAVLCAAGDDDPGSHVHGSCHRSPFKVVLVGTRSQHPAVARVYSSATGIWGDLVSTPEPFRTGYVITSLPCTLVGSALYWWLSKDEDGILKFDLASQSLAVIKKPPFPGINSGCSRIIAGDDGGVRLAVLLYPGLQMWDCKVNSDVVATWVLHEIFNIHEILDLPSEILDLPFEVLVSLAGIVGYSEETDEILVSVGICGSYRYFFTVRLESMQPTRLHGNFVDNSYHPFTNFYTPGPPLLQLPSAENYVWGDGTA